MDGCDASGPAARLATTKEDTVEYIDLTAKLLWAVILLGVFALFVVQLVMGRRREQRKAAERSAWLRGRLDEARAKARHRGA